MAAPLDLEEHQGAASIGMVTAIRARHIAADKTRLPGVKFIYLSPFQPVKALQTLKGRPFGSERSKVVPWGRTSLAETLIRQRH